MASETLHVPEDHLEEFCDFIEHALEMTENMTFSSEMRDGLAEWCREERKYLALLADSDGSDAE